MKKHVYILFFFVFMCICNSHSQHFTYDYLRDNLAFVSPTFDSLSLMDKKEGMLPISRKETLNLREITNEIALKNLPKAALLMLKEKAGKFVIIFYVTTTGRIFYLKFIVRKELLDLITEEQLLGIYNDYKAIKLYIDEKELDVQYRAYGYFDYGKWNIPIYKE